VQDKVGSLGQSNTDKSGFNRDILFKCSCRENLLFMEGEEIILKCRIVKIAKGVAWAKCRQCGKWVPIPLKISHS